MRGVSKVKRKAHWALDYKSSVIAIDLYNNGVSAVDLAKKFSIGRTTMFRIIKRRLNEQDRFTSNELRNILKKRGIKFITIMLKPALLEIYNGSSKERIKEIQKKERKRWESCWNQSKKDIARRKKIWAISNGQSKKNKEKRHRLGISKKYHSPDGISYTKEYRSVQRHKRRALLKNAGMLTVKSIQTVYEDNIKRFGTLTCYLCLNPIKFGTDNLEHKTPLSRGGTNEYRNLAIACFKCNCKKHTKTVREYRRIIYQ